jgi:hypothetical protein
MISSVRGLSYIYKVRNTPNIQLATFVNPMILQALPNQTVRYILSMSNSSSKPVDVINTLKSAQCVCFDVDSTVIQEEGIDVLAASLGVGEQVAELTKR